MSNICDFRSLIFAANMCFLVSKLVSCRYPNPSAFTYERRFFRPFEYALQPPFWYKEERIAVKKPEVPDGVSDLRDYDGPQCFIIPGNHGLLLTFPETKRASGF